MWKVNIACALRWGSSLCRNYFVGNGSPYTGKTFQVRDLLRWTVLIRGRKGEESRPVAFIIVFVIIFVK